MYSARHFKKDGKIVCGTGRRSVKPESTTDPFYVDCWQCQRTKAYKAAAARKRAIRAAQEEAARSVGLDPEKPVGDWTLEEVQLYKQAMKSLEVK